MCNFPSPHTFLEHQEREREEMGEKCSRQTLRLQYTITYDPLASTADDWLSGRTGNHLASRLLDHQQRCCCYVIVLLFFFLFSLMLLLLLLPLLRC